MGNGSSLISIVIPTFNSSQYLHVLIDSICCQTYENFEVIFVDDGSSDGTGKILEAYEKRDLRVKCFFQENKGVSSARNRGIFESKGEYILFFDHDDEMLSNMLEMTVNKIQETKVDAIIPRCKQRYYDVYQSLVEEKEFLGEDLSAEMFETLLYKYQKLDIHSLFKKDVVLELRGFDEALITNEDWDFWLRFFLQKHSASVLDESLYIYNHWLATNRGTIRRKSDLKYLDGNLKFLVKWFKSAQDNGSEIEQIFLKKIEYISADASTMKGGMKLTFQAWRFLKRHDFLRALRIFPRLIYGLCIRSSQ